MMYCVEGRRTTLLAMSEVQRSVQLLPDLEPMRCKAARGRGRCRGKVASNSVAPFCHYHLNEGCQLFNPRVNGYGMIMTDRIYERLHLLNHDRAAQDEHAAHSLSLVNEMASDY